jgi:cold shock CspA family protein
VRIADRRRSWEMRPGQPAALHAAKAPDIFFHVSGCLSSFEDLRRGDFVNFEMQHDGHRRSNAIKVTKAA